MSFDEITISGEQLIFDGLEQLQGYFSIDSGKNIDISLNTISLKDSVDISVVRVDDFKIKNKEIAISYNTILIEGQVDLSGNLFFSTGSGIPLDASFGIPFSNQCEFISFSSICNKDISGTIPLTIKLYDSLNNQNIDLTTYDLQEITINTRRQYIPLNGLTFNTSNQDVHYFWIEAGSITLAPYTAFRISITLKLTESY